FAQSLEDLHAIDRNLAERYRYFYRDPGLRLQAKQAQGRTGLAVSRSTHVQHVVEPLDEDRSVDRQVRPRTRRQFAKDLHVDLHRAAHYRRIDARDAAFDDTVPSVDVHGLAEANVLRLGLGDPQL